MSNVLIGIIGVVLFIGLALAGALFLGARFSQARISGMTASVMQMVSQTARAAAMRNVDTGTRLPADPLIATTLELGGYVRNSPYNPTREPGLAGDAAHPMRGVAEDGGFVGVGAAVVMQLSSDRLPDDEICAEIERLSFRGTVRTVDGVPGGSDGCFRAGSGSGAGLIPGAFYAFSRI